MTPQYPLGQLFVSLNYICFLPDAPYIVEQILQDSEEFCILGVCSQIWELPS